MEGKIKKKMNTCPTCQQPYLHISTLHNPVRTIYVHREVGKGPEKKPVDFCMKKKQVVSPKTIAECNKINDANRFGPSGIAAITTTTATASSKKNIASHNISVVTSKQVTNDDHNITLREEEKTMPFVGFDIAKLSEQFPTKGVGRTGAPSVAISDRGRMTLSSTVAKAFEGCTVVMPAKDKDNPLRIQLAGYPEVPKGKEQNVWAITRSKETKRDGSKAKTKQVGVNFPLILKALNYDYAKAGNQTFTVDKIDAEKHVIMFSLPATLPSPKPKQVRVKKVKPVVDTNTVAAGGKSNGAVAAGPVVVPSPSVASDDEVVVE